MLACGRSSEASTLEGLVQAIQVLHENSSNAVLLNSELGEFFKTTVGVRQRCLLVLSPILFNFYLEKIMQETFHEHHTSIPTGGRPICRLRFADDIDLMGGSNGELQDLNNRHVDTPTAYGVVVSTHTQKQDHDQQHEQH